MAGRLEILLHAVNVAFSLAPDRVAAERILESAMRALLAGDAALPVSTLASQGRERSVSLDALGAPAADQVVQLPWRELREAAKGVVSVIGLDQAAAIYGSRPAVLRDVLWRRRDPGAGRRARVERLVVLPDRRRRA